MAYTVERGDSLWAIAERELGSGARWREIQAANNITGTLIRPGQVLQIPGQPAATPPAAPTPAPTAPPTRTPAPPTPPPPSGPSVEDIFRSELEDLRRQIAENAERRQPQVDRVSARTIVEDILGSVGLGDLVGTVMNVITSPEQLTDAFVFSTIRQTEQYRQRFAGNEQRRAAGLNVLREDQYLNLENDLRAVMRNAGLPSGFHDSTAELAQFIAGDVSPAELSRRVNEGYRAIAEADPATIETMQRFYGVTQGQLAAFFLDPDVAEPLLMQQTAVAQVGAAAARAGFAETIDRAAAERMQRLGVTGQQAGEAFGIIAEAGELLRPIEAGETALDVTETALGLTGQSPEALQRLRTQQRRRVARFQGGGQFAAGATGVTGLREA